MRKFKSKYKIHKRLDSHGKHINRDDTFLQSRLGEIYRYSDELLTVWLIVKSTKLTVPRKILQKIKDAGVEVIDEWEDDESIELKIKESDLDTVAQIMKIRRKKEKVPMDKNSQEYKLLIERLHG